MQLVILISLKTVVFIIIILIISVNVADITHTRKKITSESQLLQSDVMTFKAFAPAG